MTARSDGRDGPVSTRTVLEPGTVVREPVDRGAIGTVVFASVMAVGCALVVVSTQAVRATQFARSELRCISPEEGAVPPSADGSFALDGLRYAPPSQMAPTASMLDPELLDAPGSALATAMSIAREVAARVPHQIEYLPVDDPTQVDFDPEKALSARRSNRRGGTCSTRAGLLVLELWRRGLPARMAQMTYQSGGGHVVAEVWSEADHTWVAVDPSRGSYLVVDGRPAGAVDRLLAADRYAWTQFAPAAELFPAFHVFGAFPERHPLAQVAWPEPWLLSHKGTRPATWARSVFAVASREGEGPCRSLGQARLSVGLSASVSLVGMVGVMMSLRRRRRGRSDD